MAFGRSPHGERGLKSKTVRILIVRLLRRSPHGERGLKLRGELVGFGRGDKSLSSWRAWIEMSPDVQLNECRESLSSWRAWIEISQEA